MRRFGVAAFISVATLYIVLHLHLHDVLATTIASAKRHREHAMAGNFPLVYHRGNLYLSGGFVQGIAPALQELIEERKIDRCYLHWRVFLRRVQVIRICPEEEFVAVRQRLGRPVAVSHWNEPFRLIAVQSQLELSYTFII